LTDILYRYKPVKFHTIFLKIYSPEDLFPLKIKVNSVDLIKGMYISELDRPWVESPFLFQGFLIKDAEEIEQVISTCKYVYIDTEKTPSDVRIKLQVLSAKSQKPVQKKNKKITSKSDFTNTVTLKKANFDKVTFTENLVRARKTRDETRSYIDTMLSNAKMGKIIDTKSAKVLVANLANNIIESMDAST